MLLTKIEENVTKKEFKLKHTIEFNLPEDENELKLCMAGQSLYCAWKELGDELRTISKYEPHVLEGSVSMLERIRDIYYRIEKDFNIGFD